MHARQLAQGQGARFIPLATSVQQKVLVLSGCPVFYADVGEDWLSSNCLTTPTAARSCGSTRTLPCSRPAATGYARHNARIRCGPAAPTVRAQVARSSTWGDMRTLDGMEG